MDKLAKIPNLAFQRHFEIGTVIRMVLIFYSVYHDSYYTVTYTNSEYKVLSDAAKHVSNGDSPYKRHTYRNSPLIAFMLTPNHYYSSFGKELFCLFDVLIAIALKVFVYRQLKSKKNASKVAKYCSLFWIYNPMSIAISSRGNADSVPCFFLILSLLFLQTDLIKGLSKYVASGIFLAFSIHLRLYPLVLSFPMYLSLGGYEINTKYSTEVLSLMPNRKQITLILSCIITLFSVNYAMYALYGYEFLFETYMHQLFKTDIKHNLSVMCYPTYLSIADVFSFDGIKATLQIFEGAIIVAITLTFGTNPETLPFALFCQTVILVVYNIEMMSQYFMWFVSLLPLVVHSFKMSVARAFLLFTLWLSAYGAWLFFAYLLEFKGREVFLFIWLKSVIFFCANIYILAELVKCYKPGHGFGLLEDRVDEEVEEKDSE